MKKFVGLILLVSLISQLAGAAGFDAANMNPQSQVHSAHVGTGTVNLNCDTCHGFPPVNPVQVQQNSTSPGSYIVCEKCHAPPPDSMKPSYGNLITIHLSRGLYCINCHDADNINPTHPSTRADNGTVQVIKCENCHRDAEKFTSHVNGGKYCLNCHGNKTSAASIAATSTPVSTVPVQTVPVSTYAVPADTGKTIYTVKLDKIRGFYSFIEGTMRIKAGDEIIWTNEGTYPITLVSADGSFEPKFLDNGKRSSYIFKNPGTYNFYLT